MFFTPIDKILLSELKKAQKALPEYVIIDSYSRSIIHSNGWESEYVHKAEMSGNKIISSLNPYEIDYALAHLIELGLVEKHGTSPSVQVTYRGWYNQSVLRREALSSLLNNLFFPSIVAIISSVITTLVLQLISSYR